MPRAFDRIDHRLNLNFRVEIDGIAEARFTSIRGLESTREVFEYREGGENTRLLKFPGPARHGEITLERGYVDSDSLFKWLSDSIEKNDRLQRRSGSIVLLNSEHEEIRRWNFHRAFPVKWRITDLNSQVTSTMIESLTLAHEGLDMVSV